MLVAKAKSGAGTNTSPISASRRSSRNNRTVRALILLERIGPSRVRPTLREFTWHHLLRRCHNERLALKGHRGDIYHAEFSPRTAGGLPLAGKDGTVRL